LTGVFENQTKKTLTWLGERFYIPNREFITADRQAPV